MPQIIPLATSADGPALAAIYRPAVTASAISFEFDPPDAAEMSRRVERCLDRMPWLVCELEGRVVGYAYAGGHRERAAYQWSADVSAYVHQDSRRMGIARALYTSLFAVLALQGFRTAFAGITLPNAASVGLHEAIGFAPVGIYRSVGYKFGTWHDVAWYGRQLGSYVVEPTPPIPLPDLAGRNEIAAALAAGAAHLRPAAL